jgi:hypothetical protein
MTETSASNHTHTAAAVLFGDASPDAAAARLSGGKNGRGVTAKLNIEPALQAAAHREIAMAASGLLQIELVDLLVAGWRKYEDLLAAARRSLASPGATELVKLATHRVTANEHPYVDLLVDGAKLATVDLELLVVFDVSLLIAAVRSARIVALHSGRCDITASLAVDGAEVATGHHVVDLPLVVTLGDGIPLLATANGPNGAGEVS